MLLSLAWMIVFGMGFYAIFKALGLPGLLGLLGAGMLLGPEGLNWLDPKLLAISSDLRTLALIVILFRAGLGLNRVLLKQTGQTALFLSIFPVLAEGAFLLVMAVWLFNFGWLEAGVLGFIIAAVSPAIVVPAMLRLIRLGQGMKRRVPVIILAAASVDDVIAVTLASMFLGAALGQAQMGWLSVLSFPLAILFGLLSGLILGLMLAALFRRFKIRDSKKVMVLLATGIVLVSWGTWLEGRVPLAPLLGVMVIGLVLVEKNPKLGVRLADKFDKIWVFTELLLFVLVGAALDLNVLRDVGLLGLLFVAAGLTVRFAAVIISTVGAQLLWRERIFIGIAFLPKATVQAALGALPLSLGMRYGADILALSVLAIVVSAPLGAIGLRLFSNRLLTTETGDEPLKA